MIERILIVVLLVVLVALIVYNMKLKRKYGSDTYWHTKKIRELEKELKLKDNDCKFAEKWKNAPELDEENKSLKEENVALLDEVSSLNSIINSDYVSDDSLNLDSLRNQSFSLVDAKCGKELDRAIQLCDELINSGKAVGTVSPRTKLDKGVAAIMLSAFNGYADAIIVNKSKRADYEKARHDIYISFYVTNIRGESTLHAKITKAYLDAKLDVLRWSMTVFEYKRALREEDKKRRELERDDAKALMELREKARNAQRERAIYEKAVEDTRKELKLALSFEERMRLESRIHELEAQIAEKDDEVKTLTAAQQGRQGTVYVISNVGSFGENVYKIGMTRRLDPQVRINELNEASTPYPFDVHAFIKASDAPSLELELHKRYQENKINLVANSNAREFYRIDLSELRAYVASRGYAARWKMTPDAAEYRESEKIRGNLLPSSKENELFHQSKEKSDFENTKMQTSLQRFDFSTEDDLIAAMQRYGYKTVDKRASGGRLWIASTNESDKLLKNVRVNGKRLVKASQTRNFNGNPGWFAI